MSMQLQKNNINTHKLIIGSPIKSTTRTWLSHKVLAMHKGLNLVPQHLPKGQG